MVTRRDRKYFFISCLFHLSILLLFALGFDSLAPLVVIENTNKTDIISAVVLGDTNQSKILPQHTPQPIAAAKPVPKPKPEPQVAKEIPKPVAPSKVEVKKAPPKTDAIALQKKKIDLKKQHDLLEKSLLAEMKTHKEKQIKKVKKVNQASQETLKAQFEKTLRDNLLFEDIKMKGTQSRQAQGIVNKYQALIIQAISEHWVVPAQANKKLYSLLLIRLGPGGTVLDVQVTKTSGDPAVDSSARAAVFKASPLPVPKAAEEFELFKQFTLKVKPENVLSADSKL